MYRSRLNWHTCNNSKHEQDPLYTVVPAKSDSDVIFCLQLLSKTLICTFHLSKRESIDHLCINPIRRIGLIHKCSIDYRSMITM